MRFVLAIISFVLGVVLVGLGVGQRTVFAPPSSTVAATTTKGDAPVTVIPGRTLVANAGHQRVRVSGSSQTAFAAYGRSSDVNAWVGKARHNTLSYDATTSSLHDRVSGTQRTVPSPKGSDLWYGEYEGHTLDFTVDLPSDTSLVVVSTGSDPAPAHVSVTWPRDTATPSVGPLLTAGGFFVALGIALYVWALVHQRRLRGPRRRSGGTKPPRARVSRRRAVAAGAQVPPRSRRGRRMVAVAPVVALTTLVLAGCSSQYWPQGGASTPTPTPTATATPGAPVAEPTAATLPQIRRVVGRIASVAAQADSARDATTAAERFTGPALDFRKANYAIRATDSSVDAPPAIPSSGISVALPQQTDTWPRTVFVVVSGSSQQKDVAPQALTLVQASPRAAYKVEYDVSLEADAALPSVAPVTVGAARLSPQVKLLTVEPGQLASAYADILAKDTASQYADEFATQGDELRQKIGKSYKDQKAKSLSSTAKIAYSSEVPSPDSSVALATNGAGALVSTSLDEIETVTPTQSGATVNTEGAVKALSKVGSSTKGISATYGVQVLFSVPPIGSKAKIELLGFTQGLIAANEVQ